MNRVLFLFKTENMNIKSYYLRCVIPAWLSVCGVLFAGIVAVLAAWMPARKATRISPNEAIRSE